MDRRTTLAITLCFLIYLGWQKFYLEPRLPHAQQPTQQVLGSSGATNAGLSATGAAAEGSNPNASVATIPSTPNKPAQTLTVQTGTGEALLGDGPKLFKDWKLKSYKLELAPEAAAVDMASVVHQSGEVDFAFDDPDYAYLSNIQGTLTKNPSGAQWVYEDGNVKLTRSFLAHDDQNYIDVQLSAEFKKKKPNYAFVSLDLPAVEKDNEERDRQLVYWTNDSIERVVPKKVELKQIVTPVKYIGVNSRYFLMALVNQSSLEPKGLLQPLGNGSARVSLVYPVSGNSISLPFRSYFGPKELELMRGVEPALDHTVDFGWFTIFAYPILKFLKFLYVYVGNYGVAIILLTLLLKLVTYPLTYKSMKNMKEMAKIQPQIAKIKEKYKDDKETLNREMLAVMKNNGANPMAGCLPMLIQMPIFFALYRVLYSSIELYHAPFAGYIHDLSAPDRFYITPVVLSLTMFVQQKLTPNTATDPAQQKMLQFMPLIFGAFMLSLPAGLTLYMLVNAIASIGQQLLLNKKLGTGRYAPTAIAARAK